MTVESADLNADGAGGRRRYDLPRGDGSRLGVGSDIAAANERIDDAAQNSRAMEGIIYEQEIANDIRAGELNRQAVEDARELATDVSIETERAISRADDAL